MSIIGTYWTPSNLADLQQNLKANVMGTDAAVQACGSSIDPVLVAGWNAWRNGALVFCGKEPSFFGAGAMADQGQQYQAQLGAWQDRLSDKCSGIVKTTTEAPPTPLQTALKYAAVVAVFVSSAYVIGQVVSVLPRRNT